MIPEAVVMEEHDAARSCNHCHCHLDCTALLHYTVFAVDTNKARVNRVQSSV